MKILIVDDDKRQLNVLDLILRRQGFNARTVDCAANALSLLKTNQSEFDLVVTDFTMPDMDGIQLLKVIKARYPSLPVVMISASDSNGLETEAKENGCSGFIRKPFTLNALEKAVLRHFPAQGQK